MEIDVVWRDLDEEDDGWNLCRCLYAYLTPGGKEILYVGKAWGNSVRQRWRRSGKENFWADLERERGIRNHIPMLGELEMDRQIRLTSELLSDVESLLIFHEKPWGNIQSRHSRIIREGLRVRCLGGWPGERRYQDG